jgi:hypothetical protein
MKRDREAASELAENAPSPSPLRQRLEGASASGVSSWRPQGAERTRARDLSLSQIVWTVFPPLTSLLEGQLRCRPGECLFACCAFWMNVASCKTLFDPGLVRVMTAAAIDPSDVGFETVAASMAADTGCATTPEGLRSAVLRSDTWGNHAVLHLLAKALTRVLAVPVGFVVLKVAEGSYTQRRPILIAREDEPPAVACVLAHVNEDHYRLISSCDGKLMFRLPARVWTARLRDLPEEADGGEQGDVGAATSEGDGASDADEDASSASASCSHSYHSALSRPRWRTSSDEEGGGKYGEEEFEREEEEGDVVASARPAPWD